MLRQHRSDLVLAAAIAAIALAISPIAIEWVTGRLVLSPRVTAISLTFDCFLLVLAAAALLQGRGRKIAIHVAAWVFPIVILAGLEIIAIAVHLSDRVALVEDNSTLKNWSRWPAHLLSNGRWAESAGDVRLYRPWHGDGIAINDLGLRTAPPTPKAPGEWRIAVTGGSAAWGFRVLDADTIPAQLQDVLRRSNSKVTVYNFGIEGAELNSELALLQRFRTVYGIDQVVFYTGGNNVISSYLPQANAARGLGWLTAEPTAFELFKTVQRLWTMSSAPSAQLLAHLDADVVAPILRNNTLREGIRTANAYCDQEQLRCDFILQPLLFTRNPPRGSEALILRTLDRQYPRLQLLNQRMYADVFTPGTPGHIHNFADVFDAVPAQLFIDMIHLNEEGNRFIAGHIAKIVPIGESAGPHP